MSTMGRVPTMNSGRTSPTLGMILEVYSWHMYSQTQYETRDTPWNWHFAPENECLEDEMSYPWGLFSGAMLVLGSANLVSKWQ